MLGIPWLEHVRNKVLKKIEIKKMLKETPDISEVHNEDKRLREFKTQEVY